MSSSFNQSIFLEVEGFGDYLPKYAGNLDIMTASAARTAEMFAQKMLDNTPSDSQKQGVN